jgi:hypothetical protein
MAHRLKNHPLLPGEKLPLSQDKSTQAILSKLATPRSRNVVGPHANVASVGHDEGVKPRAHDGAAGDGNAATNAALADAGRSTPRRQPSAGEMVASGLTGTQFAGLPSPTDN